MGHGMAGSDNKPVSAPQTPKFTASAPPEPVSGPIPGPQPGFAPEHLPHVPQQQPNNMYFQQGPQVQHEQQTNNPPAPGQPAYQQFNQHPGFSQTTGGPPIKPQYTHSPTPPQIPIPSYSVPWSTGLFDCFDDPTNTFITFCVPCVTFGQVAEILDQGSTSCATHATMYSCVWFWIWCPFLLSCSYRTKLRAKYELMESPAPDWLTHFMCELCALCQMHRELVNRGIDPTIGWHANIQRMQQQQQMQTMAPPSHQTML